MSMSRSESRRHDRQKRKRRMRRLLAINLTMLTAIILLISFIVLTAKPPFGGTGEQKTADQGEGGSGKAPGGTAAPGTGTGGAAATGKTPGGTAASGSAPDGAAAPGKAPGQAGGSEQTGSGAAAAPPEVAAPRGGERQDALPGRISGGIPSGETVRLAFVGDIMLGSSVEKLMRKKGLEYPFEGALPYLQRADLTAGNLENPITKRGVPAQNKSFVFKGAPDLLPPLKNAGFDIVSLANNHTLDQGIEGLLDTMRYLDEAGIRHAGGGRNDTEAFAPVYLETKGVKVAYIGLSRVVPESSWKADKNRAGVAEAYDASRAKAAIRDARKRADLVVVMVHWGVERQDYPVQHQKTLAHAFVDAGADVVIGSHPHVMQGFEYYKNRWIAYSLGNFIFNTTSNPKTKMSGVLDAVCTKNGECGLKLNPMFADNSRPVPMKAADGAALLARLSKLSVNVVFDKDGVAAPR